MWGALAAAFVLGSSSAAATQPSRIVFVSSRTTVSQLYSVEPSGRGLAQLTFGRGGWGAPLPSPDGRFVAAFRGSELWLMRGDGRSARLIATNASYSLSWSRDSRRLAFERAGAIWTAVAAAGPPRQITHGHDDSAPTLSPDGRSIAFLRSGMLVVRRHGRERIVLRSAAAPPTWSPDGKWIAVVARDCASCALSESSWSPDSR